eukprot:TRINITY_DN16549_c0_g1_i1.p1 TRINITY_DN16549_c0_g1~~TRINITY_DN16549_c0_g1_i1.p1  ORF type:complete len:141 (-),score=16.24 TRINITY_DN16549_c0_g1_i1:57-479(-)
MESDVAKEGLRSRSHNILASDANEEIEINDSLQRKAVTEAVCEQPTSSAFSGLEDLIRFHPSEKLHLRSPSFRDGARIPRTHTAEGMSAEISPAAEWHFIPQGTTSLALVMEDVDVPDPKAPIAPFTHWFARGFSCQGRE